MLGKYFYCKMAVLMSGILMAINGFTQNDTFEPNDSRETASKVVFGGEFEPHKVYWASGYDVGSPTHADIYPADDMDWYQLDVNEGDKLNFELRPFVTQIDLTMYLYFGTSFIAQKQSNGAGETEYWDIDIQPNSGGTYYIVVGSWGDPKRTGTYRIMITKTMPVRGVISLTYPTDPGVWLTAGQTVEIKWSTGGSGNPSVKIELYKGGTWCQNIKSDAANSGTYLWPVPLGTAIGSDYKIKITSNSDPLVNTMSSNYFVISTVAVKIKTGTGINTFSLSHNYPNPFNPQTRIEFSVKEKCRVVLKIVNALGREIATLEDGLFEAGEYAVDYNARGLSAGIYFYSIQMGEFRSVKKMILLE